MTPVPLKSHLLHPSGGLIWHWRALRNRQYWQPLINALSHWIDDWLNQLPEHPGKLVLVGPSAGWTLPVGRLQRFESITIFEPDLLARQVWKTRLDRTRLQFDFHDVFSEGGLRYLHDAYPSHAILFCNVLGQLSPHDTDAAQQWCHSLRSQLSDRHWASYHDWISTSLPPSMHDKSLAFAAGSALASAMNSFWRDSEIEVIDHNTEALAEGVRFSCIPWRLRKNQWHLIQWVSHIAS